MRYKIYYVIFQPTGEGQQEEARRRMRRFLFLYSVFIPRVPCVGGGNTLFYYRLRQLNILFLLYYVCNRTRTRLCILWQFSSHGTPPLPPSLPDGSAFKAWLLVEDERVPIWQLSSFPLARSACLSGMSRGRYVGWDGTGSRQEGLDCFCKVRSSTQCAVSYHIIS